MKRLILLLVMVIVFGNSYAKAATRMVEIGSLARSQGFNTNNLLVNPPIYCYSKKAIRSYNGKKIQYQNAVFLLMSQLQNKGRLLVSAETKCIQEYWNTKDYPPTQWQFFNFDNHYPTMYQGGLWDSMIRSEDLPWCQVSRLELVNYRWESEGYDKLSFRRVVIYISGGEFPGFRYMDRFVPEYSFSEYFLSKDVRCFKSKEEAVRGGFKLLE